MKRVLSAIGLIFMFLLSAIGQALNAVSTGSGARDVGEIKTDMMEKYGEERNTGYGYRITHRSQYD